MKIKETYRWMPILDSFGEYMRQNTLLLKKITDNEGTKPVTVQDFCNWLESEAYDQKIWWVKPGMWVHTIDCTDEAKTMLTDVVQDHNKFIKLQASPENPDHTMIVGKYGQLHKSEIIKHFNPARVRPFTISEMSVLCNALINDGNTLKHISHIEVVTPNSIHIMIDEPLNEKMSLSYLAERCTFSGTGELCGVLEIVSRNPEHQKPIMIN